MKASSESGLWAQTISVTELGIIDQGSDRDYHNIADRFLPEARPGGNTTIGSLAERLEFADEALKSRRQKTEQFVNSGHIASSSLFLQRERILIGLFRAEIGDRPF